MGDAMDYFNDLGLEYNVDYVDVSNKVVPKKKNEDLEEDIKNTMNDDNNVSPVLVKSETIVENNQVEKNENTDSSVEDDDNLFDLIDSMYKEKED